MLNYTVVLCFLLFSCRISSHSSEEGVIGGDLIAKLKNDANLDLSVDEEYEDLRAELLAYHTALSTLSATSGRRSMASTPCWLLGGICVNYKLCSGFRYLTEVPGCKDKHNVCCFTWNRYNVQDMRDQGLSNLALPWSIQHTYGGEGIKVKEDKPRTLTKKKRNSNSRRNDTKTLALILNSL